MRRHKLQRKVFGVMLAMFLLVGCGTPTGTLQATPPQVVPTATSVQPTRIPPTFTPVPPTPTPTSVPTTGRVVGILLEKSTQKPVAGVVLQLTPVSMAEGKATYNFNPNNLRAESDTTGVFSFSGVFPGKYSIWASFTPIAFPLPLTGEEKKTIVFEVLAGQAVEMGKILVEK